MRRKKIPMRMCIGCKEKKPKNELVRIVRTVDGKIEVDTTGKKSGRGAYLCKNPSCAEVSLKENKISKALDFNVTKDALSRIKEELTNLWS